jgi:hypothetical protein
MNLIYWHHNYALLRECDEVRTSWFSVQNGGFVQSWPIFVSAAYNLSLRLQFQGKVVTRTSSNRQLVRDRLFSLLIGSLPPTAYHHPHLFINLYIDYNFCFLRHITMIMIKISMHHITMTKKGPKTFDSTLPILQAWEKFLSNPFEIGPTSDSIEIANLFPIIKQSKLTYRFHPNWTPLIRFRNDRKQAFRSHISIESRSVYKTIGTWVPDSIAIGNKFPIIKQLDLISNPF